LRRKQTRAQNQEFKISDLRIGNSDSEHASSSSSLTVNHHRRVTAPLIYSDILGIAAYLRFILSLADETMRRCVKWRKRHSPHRPANRAKDGLARLSSTAITAALSATQVLLPPSLSMGSSASKLAGGLFSSQEMRMSLHWHRLDLPLTGRQTLRCWVSIALERPQFFIVRHTSQLEVIDSAHYCYRVEAQ